MIEGRYEARGDGRAIALEVVLPELQEVGAAWSGLIPGPFVVVSALVSAVIGAMATIDLYIVGGGLGGGGTGGDGPVGTVRLMSPGARVPFDGGLTPGGVALAPGGVVEWYPWFVFEGAVGNLLMVVRRPAEMALARVGAALSVWPLVDAAGAEELAAGARRVPTAAAVARRRYVGPHMSAF